MRQLTTIALLDLYHEHNSSWQEQEDDAKQEALRKANSRLLSVSYTLADFDIKTVATENLLPYKLKIAISELAHFYIHNEGYQIDPDDYEDDPYRISDLPPIVRNCIHIFITGKADESQQGGSKYLRHNVGGAIKYDQVDPSLALANNERQFGDLALRFHRYINHTLPSDEGIW